MNRSDTRERLLDAAITLVARGGLKGLSHRAVEAAAGTARGSASYHLGSRHEIVESLMERLASLDLADMEQSQHELAMDYLASGSIDLSGSVQRLVRALLGDRDRVLARYSLMLEAARDETLQPIVRRWREVFLTLPRPLLHRLGAPDPEAIAHDMVTAVDGVILEYLSTGRNEDLVQVISDMLARMIRQWHDGDLR